MHSFRLRYVALGLLIYIQSAFSRTCGTDFDDAASSAVIADTVLLATATRAFGGGLQRAGAVRFLVERVYKGNIPDADVGDGGGRRKPSRVVALFGAVPDRERCVAPPVTLGSRYIVFLRARDSERSPTTTSSAAVSGDARTSTQLERRRQKVVARRRRRLRISAFPVLATDDVISTVEHYANCSNRCSKYSLM